MSPNVGNFVHDLVEMAKATERLPQIEAENERLNNMVEEYAKQVQRLELRLLDRANEIDSLNHRLGEAEVSRDAAELRFLELDEKVHSVLGTLGTINGMVEDAGRALAPPAPVAVQTSEQVQGVSPLGETPHPFEGSGGGLSQPLVAPTSDTPPAAPSEAVPVEAATTTSGDGGEGEPLSEPSTVPSPEDAFQKQQAASQVPWSQRFADKLYMRYPGYVSRTDWLEGGGTNETYDWREGDPIPAGVAA